MHTHTYYFLSSLAMADLLVLLSTIPVEITYFWFKSKYAAGSSPSDGCAAIVATNDIHQF